MDYHALNKISVKNIYPLPCIDDLLDQLKNVVYFTKLDLSNAMLQGRYSSYVNICVVKDVFGALPEAIKLEFHDKVCMHLVNHEYSISM